MFYNFISCSSTSIPTEENSLADKTIMVSKILNFHLFTPWKCFFQNVSIGPFCSPLMVLDEFRILWGTNMGKLSPFLVRFLFRVILCYFSLSCYNLDYWIIVMSELFKLCNIIDSQVRFYAVLELVIDMFCRLKSKFWSRHHHWGIGRIIECWLKLVHLLFIFKVEKARAQNLKWLILNFMANSEKHRALCIVFPKCFPCLFYLRIIPVVLQYRDWLFRNQAYKWVLHYSLFSVNFLLFHYRGVLHKYLVFQWRGWSTKLPFKFWLYQDGYTLLVRN